MGSYPNNEDIENSTQWIPHLLQTFIKVILPSFQLKQTSIGNAIVQAARPRSVITPILFGLGVELDHVFGSKWLINELFKLKNFQTKSWILCNGVGNLMERY